MLRKTTTDTVGAKLFNGNILLVINGKTKIWKFNSISTFRAVLKGATAWGLGLSERNLMGSARTALTKKWGKKRGVGRIANAH